MLTRAHRLEHISHKSVWTLNCYFVMFSKCQRKYAESPQQKSTFWWQLYWYLTSAIKFRTEGIITTTKRWIIRYASNFHCRHRFANCTYSRCHFLEVNRNKYYQIWIWKNCLLIWYNRSILKSVQIGILFFPFHTLHHCRFTRMSIATCGMCLLINSNKRPIK